MNQYSLDQAIKIAFQFFELSRSQIALEQSFWYGTTTRD